MKKNNARFWNPTGCQQDVPFGEGVLEESGGFRYEVE